MAEWSTCPSRDDLQRLILGQLASADALGIEQHLDGCQACLNVFREWVASDELLEAMRARRAGGSEPTATMARPIGQFENRGGISTWIAAQDSTFPDQNLPRPSASDVKGLLSPAQSADEIGRIADFRVLRVLCVGGMGAVFEAEDMGLKRRVALKLMHPAIAVTPGATARFLREAQSAAALKHEHVVTIYQVGMHGEMPFIALELLDGETLEDRLVRKGRLSVQEVIRIGREIAMGLAAAHGQGLLHRDIKPANIWLEGPQTPSPAKPAPNDEHRSHSATAKVENGHFAQGRLSAGRVKILDFGLSKQWTTESGVTQQGVVIGTPGYMAPEQFLGSAVDPRSDLFSLGCLIYRMASGKLPFGGSNLLSVARALAVEEPPPVRRLNPRVPQILSDLIGQLLSKSPDQRPPSAQSVVDRLQAIEQEHSARTAVEKPAARVPTDRVKQGGKRNKWIVGAVVGLLVLMPLGYLVGGAQLIRIAMNKGQVVIAIDDPHGELTVKESDVVLQDRQGQLEITMPAGEHQLEVTVKNGLRAVTFSPEKFTLSRGGRKVIEVRQELEKALASRTAARPKPPQKTSSGAIVKDLDLSIPTDLERRAARWVLSLGGSVTIHVANQSGAIQVEHSNALPATAFELKQVILQNCALTDADLEHLRGLTELKVLTLHNTSVTDAGLAHLKGLTKLKSLYLGNTHVTDAGLAHLMALTNLKGLYLGSTRVTDAGLAHLQGLTKLETLSLNSTRVTDSGLVHLQALKNLHVLILDWTGVTDAGLVHLESLPGLDALYLSGTHVTDAGLAHLNRLTQLRLLNVSCLPLTDAGLAQLPGLEQLTSLNLDATQITDSGLVHLQGLKNLQRLILDHTRVTDAGLADLQGLTKLETLSLNGTQVTGAGLVRLQTLQNLRVLDLKGAKQVRDAGLPAILHLQSLAEIDLSNTHVSAKGFAAVKAALPSRVHSVWSEPNYSVADAVLAAGGSVDIRTEEAAIDRSIKTVGGLPAEYFQVIRVSLAGVHRSLDGVFAALKNPGVDALISLDLSGTAISDADLQHLKGLIHLRRLALDGAAIRGVGLEHLSGLTKLVELVLSGTQITGAGLEHLQNLREFKTLVLTNTPVTDAGLARLQGLTNLESLSLDGTRVTDSGLVHLQALKNLHVLVLNWTSVADAGLVHLKSLPRLDALYLRGTHVTDAGLAHLAGLTKLRILNVSCLPVTDAGLAQARGLEQLTYLNLDATQVTDRGLVYLQASKNLRRLILDHTRVTDAGLAHLQGLTNLETLSLDGTQVSGAGLVRLQTLKNLSVLHLKEARQVRDAAIPQILHLQNLADIDLSNTRVSAKGFALLKAGFPQAHLAWSEPNYAAACVVLAAGGSVDIRTEGAAADRSIKAVGELPSEYFHVTHANLSGVRRSLDDVFDALKNPGVDALVSLDLSGTAISDVDLERLKGLTHLRRLVLDDANISGAGVMHLQQLPELVELRLGCPTLTELFLWELGGLKKLERLSLAKSSASDEGTRYLAELTHLKELDLRGTKVTATRVRELRKALAECRIMTTVAVP